MRKIFVILTTLCLIGLFLPFLKGDANFGWLSVWGYKKSTSPKIINAFVKPEKVRPGDVMTVTAEIEDDYRIKSVTADMGGIETINLELKEGDTLRGTWQNNWNVHSVEVKEYTTTITVSNILGYSSQTEIKWTDDPGTWTYDIHPSSVDEPCGNASTILSQIQNDDGVWNSSWVVCSCSYLGGTAMTVTYNITDYQDVINATLEFESTRSGTGATMDITCGGASHASYFLKHNSSNCDDWLPPDGINTLTIPTECFEDNTFTVKWARIGGNCLKFDYMWLNIEKQPSFAVTTSAATGVTSTQATLNGNITETGGENADERGFDWGISPGNYPYFWTETGSFGTGAFSHQITGLDSFTTYYFRAKAHNSTGWAYGEEMSFYTITGNACANVPINGSYTVTSSCSFSKQVDGVDNGGITINSDTTLTINASQTVAWSPGFSIIVDGTIAINKTGGAQLRKTYLWMIDADEDGYPATTDLYAQDTAPTGGRRRYLMNSISSIDCDDAAATKWQYLTGYTDGDGDGYGIGSVQQVCSGGSLPSGYASQGGDCYDANANAKPGQTSYFTSHRGDGSFDYNCNGSTEKKSDDCTYVGSCTLSGSCTLGGCSNAYTTITKGNCSTVACGARGQTCSFQTYYSQSCTVYNFYAPTGCGTYYLCQSAETYTGIKSTSPGGGERCGCR